jgi:hypothetical protein
MPFRLKPQKIGLGQADVLHDFRECLLKYRQSGFLKRKEQVSRCDGMPDAQSQVDHGGFT